MKDNQRLLEKNRPVAYRLVNIFESFLWKSRLLVLLAVISSLLASFMLFAIGTVDVFSMLFSILKAMLAGSHANDIHAGAISVIIGANDIFLIAVDQMIFSLGL
jgi:uncharacterized membrane protein YqhA